MTPSPSFRLSCLLRRHSGKRTIFHVVDSSRSQRLSRSFRRPTGMGFNGDADLDTSCRHGRCLQKMALFFIFFVSESMIYRLPGDDAVEGLDLETMVAWSVKSGDDLPDQPGKQTTLLTCPKLMSLFVGTELLRWNTVTSSCVLHF